MHAFIGRIAPDIVSPAGIEDSYKRQILSWISTCPG